MQWNKILCPVDFSQGSRDALELAASLAALSSGVLVLVNVWSPPVYFMSEPIGLPNTVLADMVNAAQAHLVEAAATARACGAPRVTHIFRTGAAWNEIVDAAREDPAVDLIVVGTHGRTGLSHALMGSVAEKVVRHAPCNVLVARPRHDR